MPNLLRTRSEPRGPRVLTTSTVTTTLEPTDPIPTRQIWHENLTIQMLKAMESRQYKRKNSTSLYPDPSTSDANAAVNELAAITKSVANLTPKEEGTVSSNSLHTGELNQLLLSSHTLTELADVLEATFVESKVNPEHDLDRLKTSAHTENVASNALAKIPAPLNELENLELNDPDTFAICQYIDQKWGKLSVPLTKKSFAPSQPVLSKANAVDLDKTNKNGMTFPLVAHKSQRLRRRISGMLLQKFMTPIAEGTDSSSTQPSSASTTHGSLSLPRSNSTIKRLSRPISRLFSTASTHTVPESTAQTITGDEDTSLSTAKLPSPPTDPASAPATFPRTSHTCEPDTTSSHSHLARRPVLTIFTARTSENRNADVGSLPHLSPKPVVDQSPAPSPHELSIKNDELMPDTTR